MRPPLRYHGGKWRLAPWIISHFQPHTTYTEVYGGGASVLIQKPRSYAEVYNDLDSQVVNFFRVLRNPLTADQLRQACELTPYSRLEFQQAYESTDDPVELARRFLIKSQMGHGSDGCTGKYRTGFRGNSTRPSSIPAHDWANLAAYIPLFTERLRGVIIEQLPAVKILQDHDSSQTLHYVDPPYTLDSRSERARRAPAYRYEMTDEQHCELATVLHSLHGMIILSGYRSPLYDDLYRDWHRVDKPARADSAAPRTESLWINPAAQGRMLFH